MNRSTRRGLLPLLALAATLACSKAEAPPSPAPYTPPPTMAATPLKVTDVEVGRALDADKKISDKTDTFKPTDTIYVSVSTEGTSPGAKLVNIFVDPGEAFWQSFPGRVADAWAASAAC